jgi:hypothetical protein
VLTREWLRLASVTTRSCVGCRPWVRPTSQLHREEANTLVASATSLRERRENGRGKRKEGRGFHTGRADRRRRTGKETFFGGGNGRRTNGRRIILALSIILLLALIPILVPLDSQSKKPRVSLTILRLFVMPPSYQPAPRASSDLTGAFFIGTTLRSTARAAACDPDAPSRRPTADANRPLHFTARPAPLPLRAGKAEDDPALLAH